MLFTQQQSFVSVSTPFGKDVLLIDGFEGREALSELFAFTLRMRSTNRALDARLILGKTVTVKIEARGAPPRLFSGIVNRFASTGVDATHGFYEASIVPQMWLLTLGRDRAIHQQKTVIDIIKSVLDKALVPYELRLTGRAYAPREYCVQYDESPFDFISRLMEEEGIFYFFTFANGKHTVVLADSAGVHKEDAHCAKLYVDTDDSVKSDIARIARFAVSQRLVAQQHVFTDYDYLSATLSSASGTATAGSAATEAVSAAARAAGRYRVYPGRHRDAADAKHRAAMRAAAHRAEQQGGDGDSGCYSLSAGMRFTLTGHPDTALNIGYVVRAVTHRATSHAYENAFTVLPQSVPFRAPQRTPRPVVSGTHTARVVGPSGEEIWTDAHGRVKVKFHWDDTPGADEESSCWVRVAQAVAGQGWGHWFLPRVGQEVVIQYVEGDPDRPLVSAGVYNADNAVPVTLPAAQTQSVIRSRSSKRGTAGNEIRLDDKRDAEELYLHAQKDMRIAIENELTTTVLGGGEQHIVAKGDRRVDVQAGDESHAVKGTRTVDVGGNETHTSQQALTQHVGGDHTLRVSGNLVIDVGGAVTIKAGRALTVQAATTLGIKAGTTLSVDGLSIEQRASASQAIDGGAMLTLKGALVKVN